MDEQKIRNIVRQEIQASASSGRFGLNLTPSHYHTGVGGDGPQLNQNSILAGSRLEGSITFAQQTTYKIATNFNPAAVWVHGNVIGAISGEKFMTVGNAQLGGSSYYLQPASNVSVQVGGPPQDIIQSCTYFGMDFGNAPHTLVSEGHIVDIFYGGVIKARATISSFNKDAIYFTVSTLVTGWTINLSFTIT